MGEAARPTSAFDDDCDDSPTSPLQAAAGDLQRQRLRPSRDTASPGRTQQRSPPRLSRAPPPRPKAPPLHSIGARAVVSAELSSSPLYALLQDPSSLTGTFSLKPLIAALEATPPHEPLRSGCPGLDNLANGWLADANATASGEPAPHRVKPAALAVSVDPRVLRQSLFQHAIADISARERAVAFSSQDQLGETQLSPGEVEEVGSQYRTCATNPAIPRTRPAYRSVPCGQTCCDSSASSLTVQAAPSEGPSSSQPPPAAHRCRCCPPRSASPSCGNSWRPWRACTLCQRTCSRQRGRRVHHSANRALSLSR